MSIHKVFLEDAAAFASICDRFRHAEPTDALPVVTPTAAETERPDEAVDVTTLRARWDALTDTHQFHGLLRELQVGRLQALRLAGDERARLVGADALQRALDGAAAQQEKLMIFVANTGIVQIFIGTIRKVVRMNDWLNILDPGFNLHVRDQAIAASYVVTKPTVDGPVRSLECYTADGSLVLQLFGKRHEGEQTPAGWSAILDTIVAASETVEVTAGVHFTAGAGHTRGDTTYRVPLGRGHGDSLRNRRAGTRRGGRPGRALSRGRAALAARGRRAHARGRARAGASTVPGARRFRGASGHGHTAACGWCARRTLRR
ncbi:MAG: hypothetical protein MUD17_14200 [Gemmatimonadaceae bacterium]|nr:hypothetical protein [Gemmatimonadaceae bacterium]